MLRAGQRRALADLRRQVERLDGGFRRRPVVPFGVPGLDRCLPGGGLALGALHEVVESGPAAEFAGAATLFVAGIVARLEGPVLWCLTRRDLRAGARQSRPASRPRHLCRDPARPRNPARHGGGPARARARRRHRRSHPAGAHGLPPPAARRGGVGRPRLRAAALVDRGRAGSHELADRGLHALAPCASGLARPSRPRPRPRPLAGRSPALPRRRTPFWILEACDAAGVSRSRPSRPIGLTSVRRAAGR